jgi:hypothetical protein
MHKNQSPKFTDMETGSLKRGQPLILLITTIVIFLLASLPITIPAYAGYTNNRLINSLSYKQQYGSWQILNIPEDDRINTIHASVLPTGKVLLMAGSGNNRQTFDEYSNDGVISVLKTVLYDPTNNSYKLIPTPSDLFCGGHAMLQNGDLLVAGGTSGYEMLAGTVTKPAGSMIIHNEDPDDPVMSLKKGTKFVASDGKVYISDQTVTIKPATKTVSATGQVTVTHSTNTVFVEAAVANKSYITKTEQHYSIQGLKGSDTHNIYGQGGPMTLDKQDYRGDNKAYEFDPVAEKYIAVGDMNESRWYPSLPVLSDGKVLAVSGLDNTGNITNTSEYFDPTTKQWTWGPTREFPTYPALFSTEDPNVLFYSGSTAGYGPANEDREPGFWNITTNKFTPVNGLRDTDALETSGSVFVPPAAGSNDGSQSWNVMVAGGGGVGESSLSTNRTDVINLQAADPTYTPGPNLPLKLRYLNLTVTPWDQVIANGGSTNYRAKNNSYSNDTFVINTATGTTTPLAKELVGRNYHSGSLLLPDGRIMVFGGDPLYGDKKDTQTGSFEQRIEIFTPPQLYKSARPVLNGTGSTTQATRGQTLTFTSPNASSIKTARLIPPSSTTHVTNIEQRSIAAVVKTSGDQVTITLPTDPNLLTNGYYMLFVVDAEGTPSIAQLVNISDNPTQAASQPTMQMDDMSGMGM